ncbi:hypothetical protein [Paenibacillus ihumii]|uniref:hypothetical protein n=1 Tax=Paenibacillus ihumii TaxID=687436 RepID=UPI0006D8318E|nr:hypothetical protein [Paenibacillus ihumii]
MNKYQRILLGGYGLCVVVFGLLVVPAYVTWGQERNIATLEYIPIWKLLKENLQVNGFTPIYEIDYGRVLLIIGVLSILTTVLCLILHGAVPPNRTKKLENSR